MPIPDSGQQCLTEMPFPYDEGAEEIIKKNPHLFQEPEEEN